LKRRNRPLLLTIIELSYDLFGTQEYVKRLLKDRKFELRKAGIYTSIEMYSAFLIFSSIVGAFVGSTAFYIISLLTTTSLWGRISLTITGLITGLASGFLIAYVLPSIKAYERKIKLGEELPYVVSHMATLAAAGCTPERIFREIARQETETVTVEQFRLIVRDIDILGKDVITAIDNAIERSPNPVFTGFLQGFKAAITAGTDIATYLMDFTSNLMTEKRITVKMLGETLSLFSEMYTVLLIVFPIVMVIMLSLIAVLSTQIAGFPIMDLLYFITYVIVPIFGFMFLVIVDTIMPKK